ncbi:MAG: twin-arginine translocase TatA/TatE family subunit [Bryobacterales bacterium]|nr:twin-arginine translocase TatA/TatE family subunit [Bryobacterales bacterium]
MGPLGWQETMAIVVLALLIFGPRKLPELFSQAGKAFATFRKASEDLRSTWDREMSAIREEGEELQREAKKAYYDDSTQADSYYSTPYDDPYANDYPATTSGDGQGNELADSTASSDGNDQLIADNEPQSSTAEISGDSGQTKTDASPAKRPAPEGTVAQGSETA